MNVFINMMKTYTYRNNSEKYPVWGGLSNELIDGHRTERLLLSKCDEAAKWDGSLS